jgi:hypothetical protein
MPGKQRRAQTMTTDGVSRNDVAAMKLAIEQMRNESPESRKHVDRVLREEGFASAGHTAAYHCQFRALRLRVWMFPSQCNSLKSNLG